MNYARHYQALMDRAENRVLEGYSERHHVMPRCLDASSKHVVRLTPEEHYVAHQLLVKMHPRDYRLVFAAVKMTHSGNYTQRSNKMYGWLRRAWNDSAGDAARAGWVKFRASVTSEYIHELRRTAALASSTPEVCAKRGSASKARWAALKIDPVMMAEIREIRSAAQKKRYAEQGSTKLGPNHNVSIANAERSWSEESRAKSRAARVAFYELHPENKLLNSSQEARAKNSAGGRAAQSRRREAETLLTEEAKAVLHFERSMRTKQAWNTRRALQPERLAV